MAAAHLQVEVNCQKWATPQEYHQIGKWGGGAVVIGAITVE